jgi:hypothetical protein
MGDERWGLGIGDWGNEMVLYVYWTLKDVLMN